MSDPTRAALSQPEPDGMPRRVYINNPVQIAECGGPCWEGGPEACDCGALWRDQPEPAGLSDEELLTVQRAVLTRWGRQVPMESKFSIEWALDALERLRDASMRYRLGVFSQEELQLYEDRAQKVIEAWSRGDEHEMSGSDATPQPVPPEPGEVEELVKWLREQEGWMGACAMYSRIAELLSQRHPQPVPVSERLPGPEDCDGEHYCWRWNTIGCLWARQPLARSWYEFESHWLPAHALPPPVEVEG